MQYLENMHNSFLIFDHCDQLLKTSDKQIIQLIATLSQKLIFTKILIILDESPANQNLVSKCVTLQMTNRHIRKIVESKLGILFVNHINLGARFESLALTNTKKLLPKLSCQGSNSLEKLILTLEH